MHLPADPSNPILGFLGAAVSTGSLWLAQATESIESIAPATRGWMEVGGTVGLIGGLSFGCVTLWSELKRVRTDAATKDEKAQDKMDKLNEEIRTDWKQQNDKLIAVLEKLDPNA